MFPSWNPNVLNSPGPHESIVLNSQNWNGNTLLGADFDFRPNRTIYRPKSKSAPKSVNFIKFYSLRPGHTELLNISRTRSSCTQKLKTHWTRFGYSHSEFHFLESCLKNSIYLKLGNVQIFRFNEIYGFVGYNL